MFELALDYGKGPVLLKEIAKRQDISEKYLSQIVIPLKTEGLLCSSRGAYGGYMLARAPSQITARNIVEVLEGEVNPVECVKNAVFCKRVPFCASRYIWCKLEEGISNILEGITLQDMVKIYSENGGKAVMYDI